MKALDNPPELPEVVYVALGVARGHLMRASVVQRLLQAHGYRFSIYTTNTDGRAFFELLTGHSPQLLTDGFGFNFDEEQNLLVKSSVLQFTRYALSLNAWLDIKQFSADGRRQVLINDIHPAPILHQRLLSVPRQTALVNVLSEHSFGAVEDMVAGWLPACMGRFVRRGIRGLFMDCTHVVINTLDPSKQFHSNGNVTYLPPIVEPAIAPSADVRQRLGVEAGQRLIVAYFNPFFRRRDLLDYMITAAACQEAFLYIVGESLTAMSDGNLPEFVRVVPCDSDFGGVVRAADVLVSAAGLAAAIQAHVYGVPHVTLVTGHPEQMRNAEFMDSKSMALLVRDPAELPAAVDDALRCQVQPHADLLAQTRSAWVRIVTEAAHTEGLG
jgi:hypothetical protein